MSLQHAAMSFAPLHGVFSQKAVAVPDDGIVAANKKEEATAASPGLFPTPQSVLVTAVTEPVCVPSQS